MVFLLSLYVSLHKCLATFMLGLFQLEETHCLILILENMQYYLHISTIQNVIFQH